MPASPNEVILTPRSVIENKLLTALSNDNCVAVLCSQADLTMLITAMQFYENANPVLPDLPSPTLNFLNGLKQLRLEAFNV